MASRCGGLPWLTGQSGRTPRKCPAAAAAWRRPVPRPRQIPPAAVQSIGCSRRRSRPTWPRRWAQKHACLPESPCGPTVSIPRLYRPGTGGIIGYCDLRTPSIGRLVPPIDRPCGLCSLSRRLPLWGDPRQNGACALLAAKRVLSRGAILWCTALQDGAALRRAQHWCVSCRRRPRRQRRCRSTATSGRSFPTTASPATAPMPATGRPICGSISATTP